MYQRLLMRLRRINIVAEFVPEKKGCARQTAQKFFGVYIR